MQFELLNELPLELSNMFTCNGKCNAYLFRNPILLASRLCKKAEATKEAEYNFRSRIWRLVTWKNLTDFLKKPYLYIFMFYTTREQYAYRKRVSTRPLNGTFQKRVIFIA